MSVTTTAKPTQKTAIGTLEDLVLIRLLPPTEKPVPPSELKNTIAKFTGEPIEAEQFSRLIEDLSIRGLIETKPCRLTEAGRMRALAFLGIDRLPPQANWGTIQAKYLVPKALGLKPGSDATAKALKDKNSLAALLLKRKLELPIGTGTTLNNVLEAIVCQELGHPELTTLAALKERVLSDRLDSKATLSRKEIETQLPRLLLDSGSGMTGLRNTVLSGVFGHLDLEPQNGEISTSHPIVDSEPVYVESFDLAVFANTVRAAARECRTGRFGDRKVFINHVWNLLKDEAVFRGFDLARFKEKLVEANRNHLLTLTRADMAAHLDQSDVLESETHYFNSEFHFILDERDEQ